jgi:hypothetical protein
VSDGGRLQSNVHYLTAPNRTELHLLEYHKRERDYLEHYCALTDTRLDYISLRPFSSPLDKTGYGDASISDEIITEVYIRFIQQSRKAESEDYMRTLPCKDRSSPTRRTPDLMFVSKKYFL